MRQYTYIFLDVEAALIQGKQHIIEIGAIKWLPDGTIEEFSQLIQPIKFRKLNNHIQKLTGITTEQLRNAPSFNQVMPKFKRWCEGETIFIAFGDFDRKVLEEQLNYYHMDTGFIYPFVDFQQKYMIENQLKEQPSLSGLLEKHALTSEIQHRALADAMSLFKIFEKVDGHKMIETQKTNIFSMILSELRPMEEYYELYITHIEGEITSSSSLKIQSITTVNQNLLFEQKMEEREMEDGNKEVVQRTIIHPNTEVEKFLKYIISDLHHKVLITRSGLKQLSKINRLHDAVFPKMETMTLQQLLSDEESVNDFTLNNLSISTFEHKLYRLFSEYEEQIVDEFKKRHLFVKEKVHI
ncbi:3'-5' exonuclease [Lysinibacillus yapensis]|uniref:3'-5' exonuclease n=1 Tax=Ureibacillus yapensis TaxID=2304605 RepID=UPI001F321A7D|nr:3'-5' exonuclease [Lysinibacillus yapensis]